MTSDFRRRSRRAVGTASFTRDGADRLAKSREAAVLAYPPMETMRDRARSIRLHTLARLDHYLEEFAGSVERVGGRVFFAADAAEAGEYVLGVIAEAGAERVVKSKSMLTEEIGLNGLLESAGLEVVETDLGEFILQLAGERPSHIIAPALHKTRREIGELFRDQLGVPYTDDPVELNAIARAFLRQRFLDADVGITGANFAVASTGSVVLVTNEGNGRMCSSLPPIHIALVGMERLVPTPTDLAVLVEVLARSATGQPLSVYTSIITGPRRAGDPDGPRELHVVVVDNGRSRVLASEVAEILACIRCGACLNVCPVYREVGGHAYGSVYPGPLGAVLSPALFDGWSDLPYASTLCGACRDVCPVRIEIPRLLASLRAELTTEAPRLFAGLGLKAYTKVATDPRLWRAFTALGGLAGRVAGRDGWIHRLPFRAAGWTEYRDLPAPADESFHAWWRRRRG